MRELTPDEIATLKQVGIAWPVDLEDQEELARRIRELVDAMVAAALKAAEVMRAAVVEAFGMAEKIYEELEEALEDVREPMPEDDRHDGAVTQAAVEVLLPLILRKLYGQGVDYGGLAHPV